MTTAKTSRSHPLYIKDLRPGDRCGRIGLTLCPGKSDPHGLFGAWERDLNLDLDAVERWGATAVVSLITDQEMDGLGVRGLPRGVRDRHMEWWHLPIPDGQPPGPRLRGRLADRGRGRPGPAAARLRRARPLQGGPGPRRNRSRPAARRA